MLIRPFIRLLCLLVVAIASDACTSVEPRIIQYAFISKAGSEVVIGFKYRDGRSIQVWRASSLDKLINDNITALSARLNGRIFLNIHRGDYELLTPIVVDYSRSAIREFTLYSTEGATISGGVSLRPQPIESEIGKKLWKANLQKPCHAESLFIDSEHATRARFPNRNRSTFGTPILDLYTAIERSPSSSADTKRRSFFIATPLPHQLLSIDLQSYPVIAVSDQNWEISKQTVSEIDSRSGNIKLRTSPLRDFLKLSKSQEVYFEGHPNFLDQDREWFLNESECSITFIRNTPEVPDVVLPTVRELFVGIGRGADSSTLNIQGINFLFAKGNNFDETGYSSEQGGTPLGFAVSADGIDSVSVSNCRFSLLSQGAINIGPSVRLSKILHNTFVNLGGSAIKIGDFSKSPIKIRGNSEVLDNIIDRTGVEFPGSPAVIIGKTGPGIVSRNRVSRTSYTGISVGWNWGYGDLSSGPFIVSSNVLTDIGQGRMRDLGGIYFLGGTQGSSIVENIICGVQGRGSQQNSLAWGIYLDEGSSNITVSRNILIGNSSGGLHVHYGASNVATKNYFGDSQLPAIRVTRQEPKISVISIDNFYAAEEGNSAAKMSLIGGNSIQDVNSKAFSAEEITSCWQQRTGAQTAACTLIDDILKTSSAVKLPTTMPMESCARSRYE